MISMHRDELNQEFASSLTRGGIAAGGSGYGGEWKIG